MLAKIKEYWQYAIGVLLLIMTGAFLFERKKLEADDALVDNQKTMVKVNEDNKQIANNDGQLAAEENNREEIQKEAKVAKDDDSDDSSDFLGKR